MSRVLKTGRFMLRWSRLITATVTFTDGDNLETFRSGLQNPTSEALSNRVGFASFSIQPQQLLANVVQRGKQFPFHQIPVFNRGFEQDFETLFLVFKAFQPLA